MVWISQRSGAPQASLVIWAIHVRFAVREGRNFLPRPEKQQPEASTRATHLGLLQRQHAPILTLADNTGPLFRWYIQHCKVHWEGRVSGEVRLHEIRRRRRGMYCHDWGPRNSASGWDYHYIRREEEYDAIWVVCEWSLTRLQRHADACALPWESDEGGGQRWRSAKSQALEDYREPLHARLDSRAWLLYGIQR